jgi:flavin-dependent dehydrogenase
MQIVIVGAGPAGLYTGIAMARRGHRVVLVERDRGPVDATWSDRKGVMQFHHPHAFRAQVVDALLAEMPEVWDGVRTAGAMPVMHPAAPDRLVGFRCRRATFERVLRRTAEREQGLTLRIGHADQVIWSQGRAIGVSVGGSMVPADLVLDASGRSGRLTRAPRGPSEGGDCGISYVSRQYRLLPDAQPGPTNEPPGLISWQQGYMAAVFPHENRTLSTLIARPSGEDRLAQLRHPAAFDAAARAIPALAVWTKRARPITPVLPGGRLYNSYRGQRDDRGRIRNGLMFLGDAVCTTNPTAGRGVTTSLLQSRELVRLLSDHGKDFASCALAFDAWCEQHIKPWFADHVYWDADLLRRWAGHDVDLSRRLPSDLIVAAAAADPSLMPCVGPYLTMQALPGSLHAIEPRAREIYANGWRPAPPDGPNTEELADLITSADGLAPRALVAAYN